MGSCMCPRHSGYLIKHLKELGTGLVNGADDCPTSLSQRLHEGNNLEAGRAVQAAGGEESRCALLDLDSSKIDSSHKKKSQLTHSLIRFRF